MALWLPYPLAFLSLLWLGVAKGARKEGKTDGLGKGECKVGRVRGGAVGLLSPVKGFKVQWSAAVVALQFVLGWL